MRIVRMLNRESANVISTALNLVTGNGEMIKEFGLCVLFCPLGKSRAAISNLKVFWEKKLRKKF